ncbi:deoxyribonuclease TATDN1-like [Diabrotica virgifera virgifera]|uniref:Deoxyribonuclease TATDN1 n=1 Tax=Diabrotica virgifera virgifera TaxID=50390 RepID=A0ABM5KJW4_DIAVI|nr:deoxyribonuclease TATDN1-like [Diabrotica virgifera virgifera]
MSTLKFIDIKANLTNSQFSGVYKLSCWNPPTQIHKPDVQHVLERSWDAGLQKIIICALDLAESKKALRIAKSDNRLFTTVGCAPTRCSQFEENGEPDLYLQQLKDLIALGKEKVVAVGECGLNCDVCYNHPINIQLKYFEVQVQLSKLFNLPLIIYSQGDSAPKMLLDIIRKYPGLKGVIHSFDSTIDMMRKFIDAGFYIGLDTWSFRSEETIKIVKRIPTDKMLFQTNCPDRVIHRSFPAYWHVSRENLELLTTKRRKWRPDFMVTGRSEPCNIKQILDMAAFVTNMNKNDLAEQVYCNTTRLFNFGENT